MKKGDIYNKKVCLTIENYNPKKHGNNMLFKNRSDYNFDKTEHNFFKKHNSELVPGLGDDIKNKETGIEDNDDKNLDYNLNNKRIKTKSFSRGKYPKKNKTKNFLYFDPLNPYLANWANSFLKIGYNVGLHSNQCADGVPILKIQKLKPKIILPPIYKVKYNQFSESKHLLTNNDDESSIVCNKVAQKLFSPSATNYNIPRNKSKNSFMTQTNPRENTETKNDENEQKFDISNQISKNEKNQIENGMVNKDDDKIEKKSNGGNDVNIEKEKE